MLWISYWLITFGLCSLHCTVIFPLLFHGLPIGSVVHAQIIARSYSSSFMLTIHSLKDFIVMVSLIGQQVNCTNLLATLGHLMAAPALITECTFRILLF